MGCLVLACRESASSEASDGATRAGDEASDADSDAMAGPSGREAARLKVQRKRRQTQKALQADSESDLESDPDLSLEVQRARRTKRQRTDAEAEGPYWSTSGTSSDAPGAPPGPEFTQWDGADPLETPKGRDASTTQNNRKTTARLYSYDKALLHCTLPSTQHATPVEPQTQAPPKIAFL